MATATASARLLTACLGVWWRAHYQSAHTDTPAACHLPAAPAAMKHTTLLLLSLLAALGKPAAGTPALPTACALAPWLQARTCSTMALLRPRRCPTPSRPPTRRRWRVGHHLRCLRHSQQ